jgi:hypothetical protein
MVVTMGRWPLAVELHRPDGALGALDGGAHLS